MLLFAPVEAFAREHPLKADNSGFGAFAQTKLIARLIYLSIDVAREAHLPKSEWGQSEGLIPPTMEIRDALKGPKDVRV